MRCDHCLRGEPRHLKMSNEVIDAVLDQVNDISMVTFTGGEPSLNIPAIRYFTESVRARKIFLDCFYVVTNGKRNAKPLVDALMNLYNICDDGENLTGLAMSRDDFHEEVPIPRIFRALKFFHEDSHVMKDMVIDSLINEGRAKKNHMGMREITVYPFENTDGWDDDTLSVSEELYIAANGNVISACNLSYKRIDAESFGNVLKTPLIDIIQQHTKVEKVAA
jgi:MoaA/NifB/PqqE/SkfB family radical SAM enzyme